MARDRQELFRPEARAADERAIDILGSQKLRRIAGFDRAAIENANAICAQPAASAATHDPQKIMHLRDI